MKRVTATPRHKPSQFTHLDRLLDRVNTPLPLRLPVDVMYAL